MISRSFHVLCVLTLLSAVPAARQGVSLATVLEPDPPKIAALQNAADSAPWHLDEALGLPDWLELGGHQRSRFETFDEQFRAGRSGHSQGIFTRTALYAKVKADGFHGIFELLDSRQFDVSGDTPLNNGIVNTIDVLQASVGTTLKDVVKSGDQLEVSFGRHTMNIGSRRLVARNRFRNTINGFTGLNARWKNEAGDNVRAFYVIPVQRLPRGQASLAENDQEFDEERTQVQFFGVHGEKKKLAGPVDGEFYVFGLDEEDGADLSTRNRNLWTIGTRFRKAPATGELDYELELVHQTGESRSSGSDANTTDLDHDAQFGHLSVGFRFEGDMAPRAEFLFDYASGDDDPTDGENNRFDTLFGARRFEFGPTGIFGAFARANLISPGLRLNFKPTENTQVMIADRLHYLASDRDAWTTSGLVDPAGDSGDYIGNFAEIRVRWDPVRNLRVETGVAHLFADDFIEDAPNATTQGDTTYFYLQTDLRF